MLFTVVVYLASFVALYEPCTCCKGKGWYLEYSITKYEPSEPEQSTCYLCRGSGWNTRSKGIHKGK